MKKNVIIVILSILAMDIAGFSSQVSAVVIVKRPLLGERVIVKRPFWGPKVVVPPARKVIIPGAMAVAPAIVGPLVLSRAYCRNHIPPYVAPIDRINWVDRCVIGKARPM